MQTLTQTETSHNLLLLFVCVCVEHRGYKPPDSLTLAHIPSAVLKPDMPLEQSMVHGHGPHYQHFQHSIQSQI